MVLYQVRVLPFGLQDDSVYRVIVDDVKLVGREMIGELNELLGLVFFSYSLRLIEQENETSQAPQVWLIVRRSPRRIPS